MHPSVARSQVCDSLDGTWAAELYQVLGEDYDDYGEEEEDYEEVWEGEEEEGNGGNAHI